MALALALAMSGPGLLVASAMVLAGIKKAVFLKSTAFLLTKN